MIKVGSIIKRYRYDTNYDIKIEGPGHQLMKKVRIEDLAYCPCEKHSKSHPILTPVTQEERLRSITEQGYEVLYDPPAAVTLRNEVINYLNTNNMSPDGFPMERFAGIPLGQYFLKNRKR